MNRKLSVAIHESSHWAMGRFAGFPIQGIELNKNKETNEPTGITLTGFGDPTPERKQKGTYWRILQSYRWIPFRSAGLIGECIANTEEDFWMMNPKKTLLNSEDCKGLHNLFKAETIPKEEVRNLLEMANSYLKQPTVWGWVNHLADRLIKTTGVYEVNMVHLEKRGDPKEPPFDGTPFIEWLISEMYE